MFKRSSRIVHLDLMTSSMTLWKLAALKCQMTISLDFAFDSGIWFFGNSDRMELLLVGLNQRCRKAAISEISNKNIFGTISNDLRVWFLVPIVSSKRTTSSTGFSVCLSVRPVSIRLSYSHVPTSHQLEILSLILPSPDRPIILVFSQLRRKEMIVTRYTYVS